LAFSFALERQRRLLCSARFDTLAAWHTHKSKRRHALVVTMAAQLVLFAETIMGMKKAMARKDDG